MLLVVLWLVVLYGLVEVFFVFLVYSVRKRFQWFITPLDERPVIDDVGLRKFIEHGFDSELGWVRKPNTWHNEHGVNGQTTYHINSYGARLNPAADGKEQHISTYGDSFCFCRQNNDDETWQYYLSCLTNTDVLNFGVGNYGYDQALLRLKREYRNNRTNRVFIAVVPSTIVRVLCVWKHYNEFGNVFGFKPRFDLEGGSLKLVPNIVRCEADFHSLDHFFDYMKKHDYFYETKFRNEMLRIPYVLTFFRHPVRNLKITYYVLAGHREKALMVIMDINLRLRLYLYTQEYPLRIMKEITREYVAYAQRMGFEPYFVVIPQKDDVAYIKRTGNHFYGKFLKSIERYLTVIDLARPLCEVGDGDLDALYSDDNIYGGHPNFRGNRFIAEYISGEICGKKSGRESDGS